MSDRYRHVKNADVFYLASYSDSESDLSYLSDRDTVINIIEDLLPKGAKIHEGFAIIENLWLSYTIHYNVDYIPARNGYRVAIWYDIDGVLGLLFSTHCEKVCENIVMGIFDYARKNHLQIQ